VFDSCFIEVRLLIGDNQRIEISGTRQKSSGLLASFLVTLLTVCV
jgi:hypothetical protein